jgi:hypothetical protein
MRDIEYVVEPLRGRTEHRGASSTKVNLLSLPTDKPGRENRDQFRIHPGKFF